MAKFNELLPGRYNEGVSAVLGLSEQEGVKTVAPELMPVFEMEREKPEHAFPKKERLALGGLTQVADVANFSGVALINPVGSNLIVILEKLYVSSLVAASYNMGLTNSALVIAFAAGVINFVRDTRWVPTGTMGIVRGGILAAGQGTLTFRLPASDTVEYDIDAVLSPGFAWIINGGSINTGVTANFRWRERSMLPEERGSL